MYADILVRSWSPPETQHIQTQHSANTQSGKRAVATTSCRTSRGQATGGTAGERRPRTAPIGHPRKVYATTAGGSGCPAPKDRQRKIKGPNPCGTPPVPTPPPRDSIPRESKGFLGIPGRRGRHGRGPARTCSFYFPLASWGSPEAGSSGPLCFWGELETKKC